MSSRIFIIAEAGVNHNGDLKLAKQLIHAAQDSGADAIKFQTFQADHLVSKRAPKARYQLRNTDSKESQKEMIRSLELSPEAHQRLFEYCRKTGIQFLSSPFNEESVDLLDQLGVTAFKIPSGEITNEPLLKHVASKRKPILMSTGMSTLGEVELALDWIRSKARVPVTLLHCVTEYPAPTTEINLRAMDTLRLAFGLPVGYSDHTLGIEIALAAAARGATVIEKHLTLDPNLPGPDHKASLEPTRFKQMSESIRNIEDALGDGVKRPTPSELANRKVARKSLVAARTLEPGHVLKPRDLRIKRPGSGIPPQMAKGIVGCQIKRSVECDEPLTWAHFK